MSQKRLFPEAEKLKLRNARVDRLEKSYWDRLWRKGWDPAYILKAEPDDIPSLAEVWRKADGLVDVVSTSAPPATKDIQIRRLKALVLSKGPEDQNRRIVAIGDGNWMVGLFVAMLQRQVREGTMQTQGRCYARLTTLENDDHWAFQIDQWTTELMTKRKI